MASPFGAFTSPTGGLRAAGGPRVSRKDRIVQSTDTDALSSKYSAYKKGYLADPYLEAIVSGFLAQEQQQHHGRGSHSAGQFFNKMPIINIGEFTPFLS
jgi:[phosphatase 2A protein]-leucine-carboxy methyltransferase